MTQETFETQPFALTVRDYAAYAFFGYYRALLDVKVALLQVLPMVSLAMAFESGPILRGDFAAAWPIVLYPAVMLTIVPAIAVVFAIRTIKRSPNMTEAAIVSFTPDGFAIRRGELNASLDWGAFKKVVETRKAIYLARTSEAHIVPKSAFASMDVARAAAAFARRNIREAAGRPKKGVTKEAEAPLTSDERVSPPFEMNFRIYAQLVIRNILSGGPAIVLLFMPCGIIAVVGWTYRADILEGYFDVFLLPLSIAICVALFIALLVLTLGWIVARKVPTTMGLRRVAIAPGYVRGSGAGYAAQFAWRDLQRVVRTRKYLICYTRPRGYIVVPASAFPSQAEADAFFDQAQVWADAARADKK